MVIFTDRDGDILSATPRLGDADPIISVIRHRERGVDSSQSVIFTEEQFPDIVFNLVKELATDPEQIRTIISKLSNFRYKVLNG